MLRRKLLHSEELSDSRDGLLFLPGYGQCIAGVESQLKEICRDMLRIVVQPPMPIGETGRYRWADFDRNVRPLVFPPVQISSGIARVHTFARQIKERYRIERLYLAGFSQGAVVAAHAIDQSPDLFAGAVLSHPVLVPALLNRDARMLPPLHVIVSLDHLDSYVTRVDRFAVLKWLDRRGSVGSGIRKVESGHAFTEEVATEIEDTITRWRK